MDQMIGRMLDNRYELLELIGSGGMAMVYKAKCHRLNRLVAVKVLKSDFASDADFRRRFYDESQAIAMLSHPNIVSVYDVSRSSPEYIVMELIDGITLKQYMERRGRLNWRESLHFITQIMKGLSHAHSRGIIHRDIKPQNIMVLRDGSVKVADPKKVLELSNYMMGNLIGGNNNHNVPAQPQSWAEYSATSGKNRWSGAPGRMWKKAPGGPVDTGEQPYNDINKVALRCFKGYFDFGAPAAEYTVKNGGCSSCPIRCYTEYDVDPLADYDLPTHNSNTCMPVLYGTRVYPDGVHDFKYEGDGTMVINLAWSHAVDDMGLWDNYGNLNRDLLWILRMPREEATKYISEAEYDSLPWEWEKAGDPRWEVELIRRMAYGEGDLSVIAKGTLAMMEKFGLPKSWLDRDDGATNSNLIYNGFPNHHGPAEAWQVGMLYNLVYNRDCMIHEIVCETGSGAPYEVTKKVMEDFFGEGCYDKAKAYTPINENKAKLAAYCVNDKNFHDSATLCNWMWPMTQSPSKERDYHGDLDLQADFMTAVTGETYTQAGLQEDGARITQMLRAMTAISFQQNCGSANLRQEHDAICDWVFDKDPDFKAFEEGTTKLDRADMEKAKDLFYDIFGWDRTTGVPTRETLEKYDLADMADDLEKRGIYAQNTAAVE